MTHCVFGLYIELHRTTAVAADGFRRNFKHLSDTILVHILYAMPAVKPLKKKIQMELGKKGDTRGFLY